MRRIYSAEVEAERARRLSGGLPVEAENCPEIYPEEDSEIIPRVKVKQDLSITLCASSYNETNHLPRWVNQHKEFVDEIVLVDTGSFDDTVRVAKDLGIRVVKYKWNHHFADAKNAAIEACNTHWIMMMSPDWWIDKKDMAFIKENIKQFRDEDKIYYDSPGYNHLTDWRGFYPGDVMSEARHIFLFNRKIEWKGRVHEHCEIAARELYGIHLDIFRHHDSTADPLTRNELKNKYYKLLLKYNGKEMPESAIKKADELRFRRYWNEYEVEETR